MWSRGLLPGTQLDQDLRLGQEPLELTGHYRTTSGASEPSFQTADGIQLLGFSNHSFYEHTTAPTEKARQLLTLSCRQQPN